jgi:ABC-2 type transport system permease protein
MSPSANRIDAVIRRHFYVTIHSPTRLIELGFWPVIDLVLWGMITTFLAGSATELPVPVSFFLGGVILWDLVFRSKNAVALCLLEEVHSQNLISMFASPITATEYLVGAVAWGLSKVAWTWTVMTVLAWALFHFGVLQMGPELAIFAAVLIVYGISLALVVIGCVLRFGYAADELTWALAGLVVPFSAVFYPVSALPEWARAVAMLVPPAHVFEAMRASLAGSSSAWGSVAFAAALDVVYLGVGFAFARAMFRQLLRRGSITRYM